MLRRVERSEVLFCSVVGVALLFAAFAHGLVPGLPTVFDYNRYGAISCGSQNILDALQARCNSVGGDSGRIYATGLPITIIGASLYALIPIAIPIIFSVVGIAVLGVGLFGAYKLIRLMRVSRYVALGGAFLYLVSPIVLSMHSFGGTYWGVLLLPFAIYIVWWLSNLKLDMGGKRVALTLAVWVALGVFMIFNDGYTFVMFALSSIVLLVASSWSRWLKQETWLMWTAFIVGMVSAYLLYKQLIPTADSWASSASLFRSMGLDIITLFSPSGGLWWVHVLGADFTPKNLWGDGSNYLNNYIGFSIVVAAFVGVFMMRKKLSRLGAGLLIIMGMAFVLSLGPSLKVNSQKVTDPNAVGFVSNSPYRMPESDAVAKLPTSYAYKLPGLKAMRATYRWHSLTMLTLIIFACVTVQLLTKHKSTKQAGILLLTVMIVELTPSPVVLWDKGTTLWQHVSDFRSEVVDPLKKDLSDGDRIIYFPNARGDNDFLVNYITPETRTWTYNVGGDKAVDIARKSYPGIITKLISADHDIETIRTTSGPLMADTLRGEYVDKIIIPKFGLKWNATTWPPLNDRSVELAASAAVAANDEGLLITERDYYYIVELKN